MAEASEERQTLVAEGGDTGAEVVDESFERGERDGVGRERAGAGALGDGRGGGRRRRSVLPLCDGREGHGHGCTSERERRTDARSERRRRQCGVAPTRKFSNLVLVLVDPSATWHHIDITRVSV